MVLYVTSVIFVCLIVLSVQLSLWFIWGHQHIPLLKTSGCCYWYCYSACQLAFCFSIPVVKSQDLACVSVGPLAEKQPRRRGIGLCESGGRLGGAEISSAGLQEGPAVPPGRGRSSCAQVGFLLQRSFSSAVEAFQLLNQVHQNDQG